MHRNSPGRWRRALLGLAGAALMGCAPTVTPGDVGTGGGGTGGGGTGGGGGGGTGGGGSGGDVGGGTAVVWQQVAKLTAPDAAAQDAFGTTVAISDDTLIVGASNHNNRTGAAYVYTRAGTSWFLQSEVTATDAVASSDFGIAVALSGDTAVVGASGVGSTIPFLTQSGAAYVFERTGSQWSQQQRLALSDRQSFDYFGNAVAIDGDTALVGAFGRQASAGAAYAFMRTGSTWSQQAQLAEVDSGGTDWFGSAVALAGDTAVVGAHEQKSGTGAAYVFTRVGSAWSQQQKLLAPDAAPTDSFGQAVGLSGDTVVIGAPGTNDQSGQAHVFVRDGTIWTLQQTLTADNGTFGREFGYAVGVDGDTLVVGTPKSSTVFVFTRNGTTWSRQQALVPARGESYGISAGISQNAIVGGANANGDQGLNSGAAYVFQP